MAKFSHANLPDFITCIQNNHLFQSIITFAIRRGISLTSCCSIWALAHPQQHTWLHWPEHWNTEQNKPFKPQANTRKCTLQEIRKYSLKPKDTLTMAP
jgi:hypothetical protein